MAGIVYGLIIGLIPAAGATTGLITLFGIMPYFVGDPYLGVIFCVAVVASSTTGDSFSGVLLGIPGPTLRRQRWWTGSPWPSVVRPPGH